MTFSLLSPWWLLKISPGGVHLGIIGEGMPPGSPNPDSISDKKCHFLHPFFSSLLRLEQEQKRSLQIHFEFAYFSFFLTHLELKQWIRSYTPTSSLENHTRFQTQMGKVYTRFFRPTAQKPFPSGLHIHIRLIQGSAPPDLKSLTSEGRAVRNVSDQ